MSDGRDADACGGTRTGRAQNPGRARADAAVTNRECAPHKCAQDWL